MAVKGKDLTNIYKNRLVSISLTDQSDEEADSLRIELEDSKSSIALPTHGEVLDISLGYASNLRQMGLFIIDSVQISGPPTRITICGKACPFEQAEQFVPLQSRKSRSFENATLGDLIKIIASEHGLEAAVSQKLASIRLRHVDQRAESDLNLLTRLARCYGAVLKPTFGRLVLARRGETILGEELRAISIKQSECSQWEFSLSKRSDFSAVETIFHDEESCEDMEFVAGGGEKKFCVPYPYPSAEAARSAACAALDSIERGAKSFSLTMLGRVDLVAAAKVRLMGFHSAVPSEWLIKKVEHSISKSVGFVT